MLRDYDIYSFANDRNFIYLRGQFTVMRVGEQYYRLCPQYEVYASGKHFDSTAVDESCFSYNVIKSGVAFYISTSQFEDYDKPERNYFLRWKNGRLFYHRDSLYTRHSLPNQYQIPFEESPEDYKDCTQHRWWVKKYNICHKHGNQDIFRKRGEQKMRSRRSEIGEEYAFYHFPSGKNMRNKVFTADPFSNVFNVIYDAKKSSFMIVDQK